MKNINSGVRGFLKCDISIISKNFPSKLLDIKNDDVGDDDETVENNLLVPTGGISDRFRVRYVFSIFRADSFSSDFLLKIKKKYFIRITYGGKSVKTRLAHNLENPTWNQELTMLDVNPPLCQNILVEVCQRNTKNSFLGNVYVNLHNIYEDGVDGFLPTLGPCFLYLYSPIKSRQRLIEGSIMENTHTYCCRLLMAMRTEVITFDEMFFPKNKKNKRSNKKKLLAKPIPPLNENLYFSYKKFILFGAVLDVLFFDRSISENSLTIKLTLGPKKESKFLSKRSKATKPLPETNDEKDAPTDTLKVINVSKNCNTTDKKNLKFKGDYCYVKFSGYFPCVHVYGEWPDLLRKIYRTNVIKKGIEKYREEVNEAKHELEYETEKRHELSKKAKRILDNFSESCQLILLSTNVLSQQDTNLCREKRRVCHERLLDIISDIKSEKEKNFLVGKNKLSEMETHVDVLTKYSQDPENSYPDTEIWIYRNGIKKSQLRIKTEDITYSSNVHERGIFCGKIQTLIVRGKKQKIKGKLDVFLWFGLAENFIECLNMLPSGSQFNYCPSSWDSRIPSTLIYKESHTYECHVHVFQAKIFNGFDKTGLADPFIRVIAFGETITSKVRKNTLNPIWNETIVFPQLILYGPSDYLKKDSVTFVVDVLDKDTSKKADFIGRSFIKPKLKEIKGEKNKKSKENVEKLKWEKIRKDYNPTGEILIAIDLVEITKDVKSDAKEDYQPKISDIIPIQEKYRMEVLFWGVRELKRKSYMKNKMFSVMEIGETSIKSKSLKNARHRLNFPYSVEFSDIELPENPEYAPSLMVKLFHKSSFTRKKQCVAACVVPSVTRFFYFPKDKLNNNNNDRKEIIDYKPNDKFKRNDLISNETIEMPEINVKKKIEKFIIIFFEQNLLEIFLQFIDYLKKKISILRDGRDVKPMRRNFPKYQKMNKGPEGVEEDKKKLDWWARYYTSVNSSYYNNGVTPLKIYREELEEQKEFKGFTDFLQIFDMSISPFMKKKKVSLAKVKAAVKIYKTPKDDDTFQNGVLPKFMTNENFKYVVRVYIVLGKNLTPRDMYSKSDPYLHVTLGKHKISDRKNFIPKQLNPTFGKCFELKGTFPHEHLLHVKVFDYDKSSKDDLIGETIIDLENRYYSKHRAACGLSLHFDKHGNNAWRDVYPPSYILNKLCKESSLPSPVYKQNQVIIGNYAFLTKISPDSDFKDEQQALSVLHRWNEISPVGFHLVPEHVETRSLYHPSLPGIEQGKLEMWVDIFPDISQIMPPKIDIKPKTPVSMELRAIVWNVDNVVLNDKSLILNDKMSDIYVKGLILSLEEELQKTDVHYRSLNGEGNFNWRFIFHFDYVPTEEVIVVKKPFGPFDKFPEEVKHRCKLEMQIWDNDVFGDDFLGNLILELTAMPRGAKLSNRCTLKMLASNTNNINLFKIGKDQIFEKSGGLLRNSKIPMKPVLGLTGLGVLIIAVKPLLANNNNNSSKHPTTQSNEIETSIITNEKPSGKLNENEEYSLQRTLYLMKEKEKELKKMSQNGQKV